MEDKMVRYFGVFIGFSISLWLVIFYKYFARTMIESQKKFWGPLVEKIFGEKAIIFLWGPQSLKISEYIVLLVGILFCLFIIGMVIYKEMLKK